MKKWSPILALAITVIFLSSCSKEESIQEWRNANTKAYEEIKNNPEYKALQSKDGTGPSGVYYKVIKIGAGTENPIFTSRVKVLYKGTYYNGIAFDPGTSGNGIPIEMDTKSLVRGFSFTLQNMVVGDKWEIWIPYYLGYGIDGLYDDYTYQTIIKGYTTLVFEIELVSFIQHPM